MAKRKTDATTVEYGDFQTPAHLANRVCQLLTNKGIQPHAVIEPTCGQGNLLLAALTHFPTLTKAIGLDINPDYIAFLKSQLDQHPQHNQVEIYLDNFFNVNWENILDQLPEPILIIGNPPWVTNTELATLNSNNLPQKTNFKALPGLSAKTGKSNFDISEWMLIHLLKLSIEKSTVVAMLCKTTVARKVLAYAWENEAPIADASIYRIDAQQAFNVSVDACLLVYETSPGAHEQTCRVYNDLSPNAYETTYGFLGQQLVANLTYYRRWQHLQGETEYQWRSGVKHDAAQVMELKRANDRYLNKLGEYWELEEEFLYPMLKSSDIANQHTDVPDRWMLVTQHHVGEDTHILQHTAPKIWAYLCQHTTVLDKRKSSIYAKRPRFSIFGVGDYTFSPWKVAISGLYKKLQFSVVAPYQGKPVVLDDTCYFIPCQSEAEAHLIGKLLNSNTAREFYESFIFWDAKRPITVEILKKLDIVALAEELDEMENLLTLRNLQTNRESKAEQLSMWAADSQSLALDLSAIIH